MLDLGLSTAEIARILKARFNTDLTQQYVGMMLSQQRVGYQHQGKVARILGVPVQRLFTKTKPKRKATHNGAKPHTRRSKAKLVTRLTGGGVARQNRKVFF